MCIVQLTLQYQYHTHTLSQCNKTEWTYTLRECNKEAMRRGPSTKAAVGHPINSSTVHCNTSVSLVYNTAKQKRTQCLRKAGLATRIFFLGTMTETGHPIKSLIGNFGKTAPGDSHQREGEIKMEKKIRLVKFGNI